MVEAEERVEVLREVELSLTPVCEVGKEIYVG